MPRFLALNLPSFAVDRLGLEERFVLLTRAERGSQWITAASPAAAALGVRPGMSLAHGRALVEGGCEDASDPKPPRVAEHDPEGDRLALEQLGLWALRFSPRVTADPPGGLVLDLAGGERLFGGERRQIAAALEAVRDRGLRARAAVAGTLGCAWALARYSPEESPCVPSGAEREALGPLPVGCLRLAPETLDSLGELGIETVAHLYELERDALPARFGPDLLLRLDQALGRAFEPFVPLHPPPPLERAHEFEAPVGIEAVLHVLREALDGLAEELRRRGQGARRAVVELRCAEAPAARETLVLSRPSGDAAHLWALLLPRIEKIQLGFGAEHLRLALPDVAPLPAKQLARWKGQGEGRFERDFGELLDTLVGRLGRERVRRVEALESHLPERAFRGRSVLDAAPRSETRVTPLERPTQLFARPEAIAVETPGGPRAAPARLRWRGEVRRVLRCFGPERLEPSWWTRGTGQGARDYFRVEDEDGRWLWLARAADGRWFVHGQWA